MVFDAVKAELFDSLNLPRGVLRVGMERRNAEKLGVFFAFFRNEIVYGLNLMRRRRGGADERARNPRPFEKRGERVRHSVVVHRDAIEFARCAACLERDFLRKYMCVGICYLQWFQTFL